jgi:exosome complex exonuclease DIS3/RRP44
LLLLLKKPPKLPKQQGVGAGGETELVVCDTNVLLHNLDVLEQAGGNFVIPQTALIECRANQMVAYDRTVELLRAVGNDRRGIFFPDPHHVGTATVHHQQNLVQRGADTPTGGSINDENDARIRNVAQFFGEHLRGSNVRVVLLTDDAESRKLAAADDAVYEPKSVRSWVRELERRNPALSLQDLVANFSADRAVEPAASGTGTVFPPHLDALELSRGVQLGRYHRGVLRSRDHDNGIVSIRRGGDRVAVTITGSSDRNRAVDGDIVAIGLHPLERWVNSGSVPAEQKVIRTESAGIAGETADPSFSEVNNEPESVTLDDSSSWRPTGKVVGIIRRNFSNYSGSIYETNLTKDSTETTEREKIAAQFEREHPDGTMTCVFFPVDKKVPPILIRTTQRDRLLGQRIIVTMDSWPANSPYPLGHYVRSIGVAGTKDVETQVLVQEHNIPHEPFSAAVLACLPPEDYKISADNSPGREDLRHLPVISIDPPGCKDIDDALHCMELPNGNYQVGVHIADVTHYVKAGTAIDLEAANRSTSTYLVNKRLDMLPGLLTTDLCSLKGNVDRYAFSVLWEVTPDAEIVNVDFKKSLIHSISALTYQQAQSFIDQPDDPYDVQACAVKRLALLARKFRQRRIDAGALTLASPEVKCESFGSTKPRRSICFCCVDLLTENFAPLVFSCS